MNEWLLSFHELHHPARQRDSLTQETKSDFASCPSEARDRRLATEGGIRAVAEPEHARGPRNLVLSQLPEFANHQLVLTKSVGHKPSSHKDLAEGIRK